MALSDGQTADSGFRKFFMGVVITAIAVHFLVQAQSILIPLVLAFFFAYLISALAGWIKSRSPRIDGFEINIPGWLATVMALLVVSFAVWLFTQMMVSNIEDVRSSAPLYQQKLQDLLGELTGWLSGYGIPSLEQLGQRVGEQLNLQAILGGFFSTVTILTRNILIICIYTAFIMLEKGIFVEKILLLANSKEQRQRSEEALMQIGFRIRQYVALKTLVSLIVAAGSWVIMWTLNIDFAGFWAALIFVLNFIPYIGSFIAVLFPVLLTLVQFGSLSLFFVAGCFLTGMQVLVAHVIEPRLMGHSMNLSPLVILLALATWGTMWGVVGAFLCVPITVILAIIFAQFEDTRPIAVLLSKDGQIEGPQLTPSKKKAAKKEQAA